MDVAPIDKAWLAREGEQRFGELVEAGTLLIATRRRRAAENAASRWEEGGSIGDRFWEAESRMAGRFAKAHALFRGCIEVEFGDSVLMQARELARFRRSRTFDCYPPLGEPEDLAAEFLLSSVIADRERLSELLALADLEESQPGAKVRWPSDDQIRLLISHGALFVARLRILFGMLGLPITEDDLIRGELAATQRRPAKAVA